MLAHLAMAASSGFAMVATNLDNLAVMVALLLTSNRPRVLGGYLAAQATVLVIALLIAEGADETMPGWTGYLGFIPLILGCMGVWRQWRGLGEGDMPVSAGATLLASTVLFLSLSTDSLAVLAPLMADTLPALRITALIGAGVAVLGLGLLGLTLARGAAFSGGWIAKLEKLGPYAMIAVGLYVLANSATDTI
ncbi:Cadmium resistance protein CadD, predicted permease [Shimia gijangensis]|uniref:Cadmium resistance protein CadD, predicted permease n=1 Tax=Shimia gijangensis TaxID=1470563 RepID=A0A1M6HUK8_9RHOB|nr:hypothetical protein [Shimia gijangensis]SHJ25863.1 Cadmium resistance protein CadD, predicted permease [Shimia gijangensis]